MATILRGEEGMGEGLDGKLAPDVIAVGFDLIRCRSLFASPCVCASVCVCERCKSIRKHALLKIVVPTYIVTVYHL